jgi:hypothetical protein
VSLSVVNIIRLINSKICDTVKPVTFTHQLPATACMSDDTGPWKKDAQIGKRSSLLRTSIYCIRMTWCTAADWFLCNCCHLLTGQRFSRGHLGSFIAGTEDSRGTLNMLKALDWTNLGEGESWLRQYFSFI